jgi:hypothetical protein
MTAVAQKIREHGMLLSGPMVRASLRAIDPKWNTRRVLTDRNTEGNFKASELDLSRAWVDPGLGARQYLKSYLKPDVAKAQGEDPEAIIERLYPRYAIGDRIWFRETFTDDTHGGFLYRADPFFDGAEIAWKWTPSILMPRRACRLLVEITDVRIQRINDITTEDAIAEGLSKISKDGGRTWKYGIPDRDGLPGSDDDGMDWCDWSTDSRSAFSHLWDRINGPRGHGWSVNDWVIALSFKRVTS